MDDYGFIQKCLCGDKKAWDEFVDRYSRLIYSSIYSVINLFNPPVFNKDNISDIFQDVFVALSRDDYRKLRSFRGRNGASLATWLRQVVINQTIDYLRRIRQPFSLDEQDEDGFCLMDKILDSGKPVSDTAVQQERLTVLAECVERLDRSEKYFLELHMNRGVKLESLRRILKISRSAVDMRKLRLLSKLKDCFEFKGLKL